MKLKKVLETTGVLSKASENLPRAIEFKDEMKKLFSDNINKDYDWTKSIKGLYLVRVDNNYILFNMIQIYKPLKNYIDENNIIEKFNNLILDHPEKFIYELDKGSNWLVN